MIGTFLTWDAVAKRVKRLTAIASSAGVGDADKIIKLDGSGKLDESFLPTGVGADVENRVASENLNAGDFVTYWDDTGTPSVRKADATVVGKEADGFVLDAVTAGQQAAVYHEGTNNSLTGLAIAARYYLDTTAGLATTTPPSAAGNVVQYLGKAISTTELVFEADDGIILA